MGLATAFLYLASLITFFLAVQFNENFTFGFALAGLFFLTATGICIFMLRTRMEKQNF